MTSNKRNYMIIKKFVKSSVVACASLLIATTSATSFAQAPTVGAAASAAGSDLFQQAKVAYKKGDYTQSATLYKQAITDPNFQQSSDYSEALYELADSLVNLYDFPHAHEALEILIRSGKGPFYDQGVLLYFQTASKGQQYQLLPNVSSDIMANKPLSPKTTFLLGQAYFKSGNYNNVINLFRYLAPVPQYKRLANYYIGASHVALGDINGAIPFFQANVTPSPDDKNVDFIEGDRMLQLSRMALARIAYQGGNYDSSVKWYDTISPKSPQYLKALWESSWALIAHKDYYAAQRRLAKLLKYKLNPDFEVNVRILQAGLALRLHHYDDAAKEYNQLVLHYKPVEESIKAYKAQLATGGEPVARNLIHDLIYLNTPNYTPKTPLSKTAKEAILKGREALPLIEKLNQINIAESTMSKMKERRESPNNFAPIQASLQALYKQAETLLDANVARIQAQFQNLVIRGQVGEDNVAWQQKADSTQKIKELNQERKATIQQIFQNFAEIQ